MKYAARAVAACLVASSANFAHAQSPIQKVLDLISGLESKITAEGEEAKKVYTEFSEWCEERSANVGFEIKTAKSEIEDLTATIEGSTSSAAATSTKIEELAGAISTAEADLKAATEVREKEAADFATEDKELVDTISTLERAIGILEREMSKGGASMMQLRNAGTLTQALTVMVDASMLDSKDASTLTALVQAGSGSDSDAEDGDDLGAPDAAAYQSHSGNIIDTLENLLDKAKEQLDNARSKETQAKHNFEMLKQSLEDEIKFSNKDMETARKNLAASSEAKATAQSDLSMTSKGLAEDEETLETLKQDCMTKAQDYEAATKSREEELKALGEAKSVIAETTAGADAVAYGSAASFLQVASSGGHSAVLRSGADLANFEAVRIVRDLARKQHSKVLAQLAARMASAMRLGHSAGEDPFAKVKGMIADMIDRLEQNAHADASHKAYCDKELGETATKKDEKMASIDKLTAKIDSMESKSAQLKADVAALQKALADLASSQAEMTKMRGEEKALFEKNKDDTEKGLEGVKTALSVLREYYAKEDKAHDAAEGAATGIIGMLEVVESDLSKGLAEMTVTEQTSATEYDQQSKENDIAKTTKEQDVKYKTKEAASLAQSIAEAKSDRTGEQNELDAALEYNSQLLKMCTSQPDSYEERAGRREAEIAGLKEALKALEGEATLLQKGSILRKIHRV